MGFGVGLWNWLDHGSRRAGDDRRCAQAPAVSIGPRDDGQGFGIEVTLTISLPGMDKAAAEDLVKRGHVVCPYSHSIKGNVNVTSNVNV